MTKTHREKLTELMVRNPMFRRLFSPLVRHRLVIFMLHRIVTDRSALAGNSPAELRSALAFLRSHDIPTLSLREAIQGMAEGNLGFGVVFTVDDGYRDFATVAAPIFFEYDCPVTVFLATGFIDRAYWFWWDKVRFAFARSKQEWLELDDFGLRLTPIHDPTQRSETEEFIVRHIKKQPEKERGTAIDLTLRALGVTPPAQAPREFEPMTWQDVRHLAGRGIDFGPHTVSHPSLASLGAEKLQAEAEGSFARLKTELGDPVRVFCYPYGTDGDISHAASDAVRAAGLSAAVTAIPGYVGKRHRLDPFRLPRFVFPNSIAKLQQVVFGLERLKEILRRPWL